MSWETTGIYWSQFEDLYGVTVNDVALFDPLEFKTDLSVVAGTELTIRIRDDGSFGGKDWTGSFKCDHPGSVDPQDERLIVSDTSRIGWWLYKVVADDGTTMTP